MKEWTPQDDAQWRAKARGYARKVGIPPNDIEDAAQVAVLSVWQSWGQSDAYLWTCMERAILSERRKAHADKRSKEVLGYNWDD